MQNVLSGAQREIPKYSSGIRPEPAFILSLSNEVYNGASLFAIQKAFKDEFSFEVYYDVPGVKPRLDSKNQVWT
jgi:mannosyl-oligosaccharide glucosidase